MVGYCHDGCSIQTGGSEDVMDFWQHPGTLEINYHHSINYEVLINLLQWNPPKQDLHRNPLYSSHFCTVSFDLHTI